MGREKKKEICHIFSSLNRKQMMHPSICQVILGVKNLPFPKFGMKCKLKAHSLALTKKNKAWELLDGIRTNSQAQ
jgi:hypothetical protein